MECDRLKCWLKTSATLQQDGMWTITGSNIVPRLFTILNWNVGRDTWFQCGNGTIVVMLDWDGELGSVESVDVFRSELGIIGTVLGYSGWAPLRNLSSSDLLWIWNYTPEYKFKISKDGVFNNTFS